MVLVFVESANSLRVNNQALHAIDCYGIAPDPQTLGARIDSWPDSKPRIDSLLVEEDPIQKKRLASPVLSCDRNNTNRAVFQLFLCQEFNGLWCNLESLIRIMCYQTQSIPRLFLISLLQYLININVNALPNSR